MPNTNVILYVLDYKIWFFPGEKKIKEEDDVELDKEEYGSTKKEDGEDEPGEGDIATLGDDVDEDILENDIGDDDDNGNPSTSFLNRMMIQMLSWMKKNIHMKHDTNVELDEVHNYIF